MAVLYLSSVKWLSYTYVVDDLESVTSEKETVLVGPELGDRHTRLQHVTESELDTVII